ncbi:dephospho-CoA kinase [Phyllobacterium phragmitis]|uniref:Dephospho-CoA kinase n=1 Tax=Phyllobacterium phragmitis TaxID=2670329 RepID=A0A2S9IUZ8_9HYPH|nr:dephospho-CoA kinase [Phyllobacterium phragmitis]PRD44363.1 dephospho-CoA kinase [Phyllobacterium phragmitis]
MIILGLTGSIGMGKSTTAQMFADAGIPVYSADEAVHRLYSGRAVPLIEAAFPGTTRANEVDREKLSAAVLGQPDAIGKLETIVHPLVREEERAFLENARNAGADMAVLDIPLLFETGGENRVDKVVVVSAPLEVQRRRVLARPGMTEAKLDAILARQVPDAEKRARADFIVDTGKGLDAARGQVVAIIRRLKAEAAG